MDLVPRFLAIFLLAAALPASLGRAAENASARADEPPMTTVAGVDLARYAGLWHEVAKIPNRFQKQCARGATATYALREDGLIDVVNRCVKKDGTEDGVKGVAKIVDKATNAKLKVSFVSFLGWRPFWGDYWIIGLDEEYEWVVVGTPDRKYGWILARTPALDAGSREKVDAILQRNGYKREAFETSLP
ncbi:MAG TPA: lipocalin family protein [Candidatus Eisenbacteria bacterium]|nr:lipocalin family protein [Candidatus Eisenbacteria bacterium]